MREPVVVARRHLDVCWASASEEGGGGGGRIVT